jgi:hypothetical protein
MPLSALAARLPWKTLLRIVLIVLLIVAANFVAAWLANLLKFEIRPSNEDLVHRAIMMTAIVYAVVMAIPFVPGVEIGLSLIGMLGPPIVFLVYVSTVAGLSLSFVAGRIISIRRLINLFNAFQLKRASGLVGVLEPMSREERLAFLVSKAPNRLVPVLLRHRYLLLAILFNVPGNFLIGGGGGIAMMAGISGLYSTLGFFATVLIAVSPLPLAILIFGKVVL